MKVRVLILLLGTGVGFGIATLLHGPTECVDKQVRLNEQAMIIGEVRFCGKDMQMSNIYGPDIESWSGDIEFNDWITR